MHRRGPGATSPDRDDRAAVLATVELSGDEDEALRRLPVTSGNLPARAEHHARTSRTRPATGSSAARRHRRGTYRVLLDSRSSTPPSQVSWPFEERVRAIDSVITINPGLPKLTLGPGVALAPATVGAPYSLQMTATRRRREAVVRSAPGTLPPGSRSTPATGLISGTPSAAGTFDFVVSAKVTADTRSDTKSLTHHGPRSARGRGAEPFATAPAPTRVGGRRPFSATLDGDRAEPGRTRGRSLPASLPAGLALGADGTVSGTPASRARTRRRFALSDDEGRTSDYAANFGVAARLAVSTLLLKPGKVGKLYRSRVAATGGVLPKAWRITAGTLPKGVRFDRKLGLLSGTPKKAGRYRLTFQVTDGLKVVAKKTLRIDVLP